MWSCVLFCVLLAVKKVVTWRRGESALGLFAVRFCPFTGEASSAPSSFTPTEGYNSQPLLREIFGPLLGIVELDSEEYENEDYLSKVVVPFLNNKDNIFGSLSCTLFIPKSEGYGGERLQGVLANLNYGTIAINQMTLFGYTTATKGGAWGGHALERIGQSGNGNIGDLFGVIGDNPAKVVVYGPSLESKPLLDNSNPPPPIVLDIVREFICTDSMLKGMGNAFSLIFTRSVRVALSYMPIVGRFVGDREM